MSEAALRELVSRLSGELAVPAIEQKDGRAGAEPQHIDEIIRLLRIELDLGVCGQVLGDVKARGSEIGSSHAASIALARAASR